MFKDTDKGTTRFAICDITDCPNYNENHVQRCFKRDPLTCGVKGRVEKLKKIAERMVEYIVIIDNCEVVPYHAGCEQKDCDMEQKKACLRGYFVIDKEDTCDTKPGTKDR